MELNINAVLDESWKLFKKYFLLAIVLSTAEVVSVIGVSIVLNYLTVVFYSDVVKNILILLQSILGVLLWVLYATFFLLYIHNKELKKKQNFKMLASIAVSRLTTAFFVVLIVGILGVCGIIGLVIPGFVILTILGQSVYFAILEQHTVFSALKTSIYATRGKRLSIFLLLIVISLMYAAVSIILNTFSTDKQFMKIFILILDVGFISYLFILGYALWRRIKDLQSSIQLKHN